MEEVTKAGQSEDELADAELELNRESVELAYSVIARYVEHTEVSGIIIALLASALGEERIKSLAHSEYWQCYMAGKRSITEAKDDVEKLTRLIERLRQEAGGRRQEEE